MTKTVGAWTLDLGASRAAGETTFVVSPITISSSQLAKLSFSPDSRWTFGVLGRALHTRYLDSPYSTDVLAYGGMASYAIGDDWLIAGQILRINSKALNGEPANGGIVSLSLSRKITVAAAASLAPSQKQWAADRPPPIASPNPVPGSSWRVPYQP
jgi:hypothetical protein